MDEVSFHILECNQGEDTCSACSKDQDRVTTLMVKNSSKEQYDPAVPLLGIHTKETRSERDTCTPMFIAALGCMCLFQIGRAHV